MMPYLIKRLTYLFVVDSKRGYETEQVLEGDDGLPITFKTERQAEKYILKNFENTDHFFIEKFINIKK